MEILLCFPSLKLSCGCVYAELCSYICLCTFTLSYNIKCLKLPHVLLHSTIHSISVLKKTLTHTHRHSPPFGLLFIRFSHCVSRLSFFSSFHLSQAQQIAFARSFKPLLWLSMSCAHNHVYRIYHVNFLALHSLCPFSS